MTCPFLLPHQLCCVISKGTFMENLSMQKEPPQLPFSAHKKQVEKRLASVGEVGGGGGGSWREGFMEGDDR